MYVIGTGRLKVFFAPSKIIMPTKYTAIFSDVLYNPRLFIFCPSFLAALIPVTMSANVTAITNSRNPLMGTKKLKIQPQQIAEAIFS